MEPTKPNCYDCQYRRSIPGDCHSSCRHPRTEEVIHSSFGALLAALGKRAGEFVDSQAMVDLGIKLNPHGVKHGWANWPWNYDPIWIESDCLGFTAKEEEKAS